jgi:AcrR family transcriptional regulator
MKDMPEDLVDVPPTLARDRAALGGRTVDGTRERILGAALVVLRDVGHGRFSVQKVAREAGVYQGNITYYWPRRRDLVLALAVRIVDDYRNAFVVGFRGLDVTVDDWAATVVRAIVDDAITEDRVRLLPELWSMANADPEIAQAVTQVYEDISVGLVDALGIGTDDPHSDAFRRALALTCMAAQGLTAVHGHRGCDDPVIAEVREALVAVHAPAMTAALGG